MHILVIHPYYLRPGESGSSRFNELARLWVEQGHSVTVLAGQVHYAESTERPFAWLESRREGSLHVHRVYTPRTYHRSFVGRAWSFLGFALSSMVWVAGARVRPDVVIASSPSLLVALPALVARVLRGWPTIFEVRDLWPESAVTTGVLDEESPLTRALYGLEALTYRAVDAICAVTPAIRDDILARGLARPEEIFLIPNGADLVGLCPGEPDRELRRVLGWDERFVVLYAGAHGVANHLEQLIEAAELLREHPDITIACVGDGPRRRELLVKTEQRALTNLEWWPAVPRDEMVRWLRSADACVAVLMDVPTFRTVYPNKIFDAMAAGRPVLCGIDGAARTLVEEARAGLCVPPEDPAALAEAILRLRDDPEARRRMGRRGRAFMEENFSRDELARQYLERMHELLERS